MNRLKSILLLFLLSSSCAIAAPATEDSIRQLMVITRSQELINGMRDQFESLMQSTMQQAMAGKKPTPKQQQVITDMKNRMVAVMQEEIAWEKMEPMYMRLYKETFTEEEVAGMLAFYKTPAGQALIQKMPLLTHNAMLEMQKTMSSLMPKMRKIQEAFIAEMKEASK